jgi:hypothetical protein
LACRCRRGQPARLGPCRLLPRSVHRKTGRSSRW